MIPQLLQLLGTRGVGLPELLDELGLPRGSERAEEVAITPAEFERLMAAAARALDDPLLAVHLPSVLETPTYSFAELAARASATLRDAFESVARYGSLFYAHLEFACAERADLVVVTQRWRDGSRGGRYGNEYAVASMLAHARSMCAQPLVPRHVFFAHPQPLEAAALARHFGLSHLDYDRAENGIAFSADDARRPLLARDARLLATVTPLADKALADTPSPLDLVARVESALRGSLPSAGADAATIARRLRLSTRTLQRQLEEHGTSFAQVLDRVRRELALLALNDRSLSLAEVAARAGFADAASFGRAFKRWQGCSPGEFRKALEPR